MTDLTPKKSCVAMASCPSVHRLGDGELLIVGALGSEAAENLGVTVGPNEAPIVIREELLANLVAKAVLAERQAIMSLLGHNVDGSSIVEDTNWHGVPTRVDASSYYDLMGAIYDLKRLGADEICIRTIERAHGKIWKIIDRARKLSSQERGP